MSIAIVITRNTSDRIRGFLGSSMLEMAPGVYVAPGISPPVRTRIWNVIEAWIDDSGSAVMLWTEPTMPGGVGSQFLGTPPIGIREIDGLLVAQRAL